MSAVWSYDRQRTVLTKDGKLFAFVSKAGMKPISNAEEKALLGLLKDGGDFRNAFPDPKATPLISCRRIIRAVSGI